MSKHDWTKADARAAAIQGWELFEADGMVTILSTDPKVFDDDAALGYALYSAYNLDPLALKAVRQTTIYKWIKGDVDG